MKNLPASVFSDREAISEENCLAAFKRAFFSAKETFFIVVQQNKNKDFDVDEAECAIKLQM